MDTKMKNAIKQIVIFSLSVIVVSGIITLKPWQDTPTLDNPLFLGVQEEKDGIDQAIKNNYPTLEPIEVKQDGYRLLVDNIMIEEGRLHCETTVEFPEEEKTIPAHPTNGATTQTTASEGQTIQSNTGNELQKPNNSNGSAQVQSNEQAGQIATDILVFEEQERVKGVVIEFFVREREEGKNGGKSIRVPITYEVLPQKEENKLSYKVDGILTSDDLKYLVREKTQLIAAISYYDSWKKEEEADADRSKENYRQGYLLHLFGEIPIKITEEKVLSSRRIPINQEIPTEFGSVIVDDLVVGPSQITLITRSALEKGYELASFEDGRLIASDGKVYLLQRSYAFENSPEGKKFFYFNPSNYFEQDASEQYTFQFSDISLRDNREDKMRIALHGKYPQKVEVAGKEVVLERASYDERSGLFKLVVSYNPEEMQPEINIEGCTDRTVIPARIAKQIQKNEMTGKDEVTKKTVLSGEYNFKIEKKAEYSLSIHHNDFFVHKGGEIKIKQHVK